MLRSMSSALSGLRNHQVMLDVVSNDIANVSTVGFKSSTTVFSDVLTQTLQGASAPSGQSAGTNPVQIGLGSRLAGTVQSFTQGALQRTGRSTDMAVQGDGFFIVQNGGQNLYTRAGAFTLDPQGTLCTQDGMLVQGWQADAVGNIDPNMPVTSLRIRIGDTIPPRQTTNATIGGNLPASAAIGDTISMTVTAYDQQGTSVPINLTFVKSATNQWTVSGSYGNPATSFAMTDNVLTFDAAGELTVPADRGIDIAGGVIPGMTGAIVLDLGAAGSTGRLTQFSGNTTVTVVDQDGYASGSLQSYNVGQDGTIVGNYSNGRAKPIARVALAVFSNAEGLERVGGAWRATPNSGLAQVGQGGVGGRGLLSSGTVEMSNVDLAEEFTRLIVAQRGFQGNARVITTADEVLQEVVNLRR